MRVVDEAMLFPQKCSVTGWEDGPYVDLGVTIPAGRDWHLYLRTGIVEEAAEKIGMVKGELLTEALAQIKELEDAVDENAETVASAQELMKAVDGAASIPSKPARKAPNKKVAA